MMKEFFKKNLPNKRYDGAKKRLICNSKDNNLKTRINENPKKKQKLHKELFKDFLKKSKIFLFAFIFFVIIQQIEARPSAQQDSNSKVGIGFFDTNPIKILPTGNQQQPTTTPKNHFKLAVQDDQVEHIERYAVSKVDFNYVSNPFMISIWILSAGIAKIAFHMTPKLHNIFPESCLLIVVGIIIGVILFLGLNVFISPLTPTTFFLYMLPPIILDAGYFMPNRKFFDNLGTILLMAVVGTIFNIVTIGGALYACGLTGIFGVDHTPGFLDIILFTSLISAVDPVAVLAVFEEIKVNEILYIVVFGESLLNDAVTVVMYHMMEAYDEIGIDNIIVQDVLSGVASFFVVALGGTIIGIIWGFLLGFITRFTHHVLIIEPIFVFVMAYLSYLNAEMFHMSGILAITFCGITAKNYVQTNTSEKSRTTIKCTLKMLSSSAETIIFMFLGVATVHNNHDWNTWFVILTIVFCTLFRSIGVVLFSAMANRFRLHKLSGVDQFVMSYGGLRGAVAFALVLLIDERVVKQKDMFVTTTIAVIYFTVFLQGITIKPLVKLLGVKRASDKELTMNERIHERFIDHMMAGIEDIIGHNGNYNLRDKFRRFNDRYIRPCLIRDIETAEHKFIRTYSKLTMRDAMTVMERNPSTLGQIAGNESISAIFRNYTTNPSMDTAYYRTNVDAPYSRNLDIHELDYYPSKRDIFDAEIHHMRIEQYRPYKGKRNSIKKNFNKSTNASDQVNRTERIRFPRYIKNRKQHKIMKQNLMLEKSTDSPPQNLVSFATIKPAINQLKPNIENSMQFLSNHDDNDEGLTFKSILKENNTSVDNPIVNTQNPISHLPWKETCDENFNQAEFSKSVISQKYLPHKSPISENSSNNGTVTQPVKTKESKHNTVLDVEEIKNKLTNLNKWNINRIRSIGAYEDKH